MYNLVACTTLVQVDLGTGDLVHGLTFCMLRGEFGRMGVICHLPVSAQHHGIVFECMFDESMQQQHQRRFKKWTGEEAVGRRAIRVESTTEFKSNPSALWHGSKCPLDTTAACAFVRKTNGYFEPYRSTPVNAQDRQPLPSFLPPLSAMSHYSSSTPHGPSCCNGGNLTRALVSHTLSLEIKMP